MSKRDTSNRDKVGPGNPPRSSRFQPGQSGNPGGRPKIERDFSRLVNKELDKTLIGSGDDGKPIKLSKRDIIVKRLVADAAKGNLKAVDRVIDLVTKCGAEPNAMIGVNPAVLASFLARYAGSAGDGAAE